MVEQVREMQRKRRSERELPYATSEEIDTLGADEKFDLIAWGLCLSLLTNVVLVLALVLT